MTAQYYTSLSVPVSLGAATDTGGSGVNAATITVQRDTIGLAAGACGAFTGSWSTVTLTAGNDTTVTSGNCYRYRETAADNVGNSTTSGISNTAKVDNAGPTNSLTLTSGSPAGASYKSGNTIFYRGVQSGGGSFKIRNAVSDSASGPASSATAALGGTATGWTHTPSTRQQPGRRPVRLEHLHVGAEHEHLTHRDRHRRRRSRQHHGRRHPHADRRLGRADREHPDRDRPVLHQPLGARDREHRLRHGRPGSGVDATTSILQRDVSRSPAAPAAPSPAAGQTSHSAPATTPPSPTATATATASCSPTTSATRAPPASPTSPRSTRARLRLPV